MFYFYISNVIIEGFWGKYTASSSFSEDVNILIGKNGTGKTTFMDLLQATLSVDLPLLAQLDFSKITIRLKSGNRTRTVSVSKKALEKSPFEMAKYKVGRKTYEILLREIDPIRYRRSTRMVEVYEDLKNELDKYINLASLSVYRIAYGLQTEEDLYLRRTRRDADKPAVDRHLKELMRQFTSYQLALSEEANAISAKFQKDVLVSVLYDEKFDGGFDIGSFSGISKGQGEEELKKAYQELGVLDEQTMGRIKRHVEALNRSLEKVRDFNEQSGMGLSISDILPLPLFRRTQHIIDLSLKADKDKQKVIGPIQKYLDTVRGFMEDKELSITPSSGELIIQKDGKRIDIFDLSSGEKQLLILLTETLLQKQEPFIFLADEPEISLHIEWQEKIIASIRSLNPSSQIIVATHSPEIASGWKDNIIDMEDIVHA